MAPKTMWIKLVLVIAAVIMLTLLSSPGQFYSLYAQADESLWPYIYYPGEGGWIIERANGADRHVLGQGVGYGLIVDHAWSPSGRWLLWECGDPPTPRSVWRAGRADNSRTVTLLEQFATTDISVHWSPLGDDTLLVYSQSTPDFINSERVWGPGVYLIDAEQDTVVWQHALERSYHSDLMRWSPDGRYILLRDYENQLVVPADGSAPLAFDDDLGIAVQWLPDGRLLYHPPDSDLLIIEELASGNYFSLQFTEEPLDYIAWNRATNQALLFADYTLWHLKLSDRLTLERFPDRIVTPFRELFRNEN